MEKAIKESNEITVKIKCSINELFSTLEKKGFKVIDKFSIDDTYFIPKNIKLSKMKPREILSKAILVRDVRGKMSNRVTKLITYKIKNYDKAGNILSQKSINCKIEEINEAKKLLKAIGYKKIMKITEEDTVYGNGELELAIKNIKNGDNLIEIETFENENLNTIEKLIKKINEIKIPIYTNNYFVKKAEIELQKFIKKEVS